MKIEQMFTTKLHNKRADLEYRVRSLAGALHEYADLLAHTQRVPANLTQLRINSPISAIMQIYRLAVEIEMIEQSRSIIREQV